MSCETIRNELVGFHFGIIDDGPRGEVERHLVTCAACLGEYLSVKRDVELSASVEARPRAQVKSKLRAAMAQELGLVAGPPSWWQRPLAYGLAAAAVVVAMVTMQTVAKAEPTAPVGVTRTKERSETIRQ